MVAHISSFAWHASSRLLLTTLSLVNVHVCIFKGHNKSRLNPDPCRSITLLSVIFKIFESVLDSLMPQLEATAVYPNSHQCGFQRALSSLDTSFVLQETINHCRERNDCTSVAFVDSAKTFDTVWHTGVFFKLSEIGISLKVSMILVNSVYSRTFRQIRGLFQGSMLAPTSHVLYINEMLNKITRMKKGSSILYVHIACPTQADDIAFISPSARNKQDMLLICENYSSKW